MKAAANKPEKTTEDAGSLSEQPAALASQDIRVITRLYGERQAYFAKMKSKDVCPPRKPLKKIIWSWVGSFIGIFLLATAAKVLESIVDVALLVGSFGATAVLLYGAPMAEFSQPRNLIGGQVVSAIVGVTVYMLIGDQFALACALAVSLAIAAMHLTVTLHPPGGATALIAVVGSPSLHALGYWYVLVPVLAGSLLLLMVALFVNNMSSNPKRHYPLYWY